MTNDVTHFGLLVTEQGNSFRPREEWYPASTLPAPFFDDDSDRLS